MRTLRLVTVACLIVSAAVVRASAQTSFPASPHIPFVDQVAKTPPPQQDALLGTWDVIVTFADGSHVRSALSVLPGRRHGEGSVLHAAEASLLLPNPTTMEQGTWAHIRGRRFVESHFGFAVDGQFTAPAGRIGFRQHEITVDAKGETFRGVATFEVRDPTEVVVFSDVVQTTGTRQRP
jgi:hypothetical protein